MHIPKKFVQEDTQALLALIRQYPFANLITRTETGVDAMHLPFLLVEEAGRLLLRGHVAKVNPVWQQAQLGEEALVIFNGPNTYISPNHYPTKAAHGKAVPTWNYVVVHARGRLAFVHGEAWIYNLIDQLTQQHEQESDRPWAITDAPEQYIQKMLPAIVGVEIEVSSLRGQWKLSQNQPDINRKGVVQGLSGSTASGAQSIAEMMMASAGE